EQDDERRIWVVLDELPTLNQVPSLQPGLAESRQFGGCFVLGIQVISALRDLYGRNGAETISGLCGTRVVLAAPDRDTAEWSAESLGRAEVEEMTEGFSYGASTIRDGVSLMPKRELRPLALGSEIMRLENLHGWLRFPGPLPVARIRLEYEQRPKAAERFVPRPEDAPKAPASADAAEEKPSVEGERKAPLYREDVLLLPPLDPDEGSARSAGKPLASRRKPQKRKTGPIRDQKRRARAAESREGATGEAVNPGTRKRATAPAHRASPSPVPARDKKGGGAPEPGQRASSDWL
ncbi:MAG: type IV secretion system DNA-binding domain-containing protein, partial [Caldilineaceae bacterium]|nr:type IV secretion system DNA-binding domain-containing protein [Caldilineaceae bacterium]